MEETNTIEQAAQHVFDVMAKRVSEEDLQRIKDAYAMAAVAHEGQKRNTGEPYIVHPIAVANIAAEELELDANTVIAAFLHDVVEDTSFTLEDIRERFGDDVAFLVDVVTKRKKHNYVKNLYGSSLMRMMPRTMAMVTLTAMKPLERARRSWLETT